MTKNEILDILKSPGSIEQLDISVLKELKEKYPFAPVLQMLYAKSLHNQNSIYFEQQLKETSLVCTDRRKLYQLIHQSPLIEEIKKFEKVTEPQIIDTSNELANKASEPEITSEPIEPKRTDDDQSKTRLDQLEQNILVAAVNSSIHSEILEYEDQTESREEIKEEDESKDGNQDKKPNLTDSKFSFDTWLDVSASKQTAKRAEISNLIDQFTKSKKESDTSSSTFFSATNLAKLSLVDKEEFVTETLAKIYADQDQFEKAIRAYETLSLKYPEKSVFFATRIKELKLKNKSK